jgi:hypothetical protein
VGNAWYVSPLTTQGTEPLQREGVSVPRHSTSGTAPTPDQVFATLTLFPEYRVRVRRRERKDKGQAVYVELRRPDGSYAIDIHLLRVSSDDQPAGVFIFEYYRETEVLIRLVSKLAELCGPLVLWHDSGCEKPILVSPAL